MMPNFYRFPHTPHLAWLGNGPVRDDKILTPQEAKAFLAEPVAIEEKVDGANIGFSLAPGGGLRNQQRGDYLQLPYKGQFSSLTAWLALHGYALEAFLQEPQNKGLICSVSGVPPAIHWPTPICPIPSCCLMLRIRSNNASGVATDAMPPPSCSNWPPFPSSMTTVATHSMASAARSISSRAAITRAPLRE
jgi:hypothetical protein